MTVEGRDCGKHSKYTPAFKNHVEGHEDHKVKYSNKEASCEAKDPMPVIKNNEKVDFLFTLFQTNCDSWAVQIQFQNCQILINILTFLSFSFFNVKAVLREDLSAGKLYIIRFLTPIFAPLSSFPI